MTWYQEWFGEEYLELYSYRDEHEARQQVSFFRSQFGTIYGCVLDLACGMGRHMAELQALGYSPIGCDLSWILLRTGRTENGTTPVARADMRNLPFCSDSFGGLVNFFTSFGYFATEDENQQVVREMSRVLKRRAGFLFDYLNVHPELAAFDSRGDQEVTEPGCIRVPLDQYPGMNRFVLDWLNGDERFLKRADVPRRARNVDPALVTALDQSNRRWGSFVSDELRRWSRGETVTLVAGQQVGFAGGPLYTLAKIASLIRMKRDLESRGTPATIFFWMATEDHDFDEAATLHVPVSMIPREKNGSVNRQLDLATMRATRTVDSKSIVGTTPVPESLITQLLSLFDMQRPSWLREGITFRDSFAELLASA